MGKYMRGRREAGGDEVAAVEVVGVRTRSRAASAAGVAAGGRVAKVVPKRRKALPPSTVTALTEPAAVGSGGDGGSCYLHLRSRMLFKAPPAASPQKPPSAAEAAAGAGSPLPAGLSRCSSTASSIDVSAHQERSAAYRSDATEAGGDHVVREGSVCNSGCGQQDRERREATPSSQARGELSDLESDLAGQKSGGRSLPAAASPVRVIVKPPASELEKFFAASEAADAERFASKYNFDVVRGVPLDAGRFEWTPVVSN